MSSISSTTSATPLFNVGGLASGLDTNTIITQLMAIERQPQVQIQQRITVEQARQQALTDVQTSLQSLQTAINNLSDPTMWANQQTVSSNDTTKVTASYTSGASGAPPGGYNITVTQLARAQQLTQGSALTNANAADTLHISVGGGTAVDVSIASGATIQQITDSINGATGIGVFAADVNGQLVLSSKTTGAANTISVTSDGTLAADLGLAESQSALDSNYTVDGVAKTSSSNVVTDAVSGVTLGLVGLTSSAVTVLVGSPGPNTSLVESNINSFVTAYNSTLTLIEGKLNEQKVASPQTVGDMTKGVLFNDPGLSDLLSNLREAVGGTFAGIAGGPTILSEIGISTGPSTGSGTLNQDALDGKLTVDTTALESALSSNLAGVKAIVSNATGSSATEGLAQRLNDELNPYLMPDGVVADWISSEQSTITDLQQQSSDMDVRLALKEQQLRTQFTAMEVALSNAQATASQLGYGLPAASTPTTGSSSSSTSTTGG